MFQSLLPHIPAAIPAWWYYLCVGSAVLITGISKAGFGGGVGILAIPVMALVLGPTHMLGVMLPLLVACDIFSNLHHIGHYDWPRLRPLLVGILIGIALGTGILLALRGMPPATFNNVMGCIVGGMCLIMVFLQAYRLTGREVPTLPAHPGSAVAVGAFSGTVSTINHAAGPVVTIYLLQEKLPKRKLVGTLLFYFLVGNILKLPTYCLLPMVNGRALINADTLHDSIWFIPLIPIGTVLGAWMHHRVAEKPFAAIMYIAAALSAADMIYKTSPTAALVCALIGVGLLSWAWLESRRRVRSAIAVAVEDAAGSPD